MIGPLPKLYRWRTAAAALFLGTVAGLWLAVASEPLAGSNGALSGALIGLAAAYFLLHDRRPSPRRA